MSQQSEIFSRYRSLFNSNSVKPTDNPNSRRLDNLDFVDFLFELVRATKGQKQFKNIILRGSLSQLKKTNELNTTIKDSFFKQYGCDNTLTIPTIYTTKSSLGVEMGKSEIDAFGLFGLNPDDTLGSFLYEGNDPKKDVNFVLYKAQAVNSNNPLSVDYNGNMLFQVHAKNPNTFIFKFGEFYENKLFNEWLNDYLDLISPIYNTVNFTTILTNLITGSVSLSAGKTQIEFREESRLIMGLKKIFGFCTETDVNNSGSLDSESNDLLNQQIDNTSNIGGFGSINETDQNPFSFNFNDLDEIERDVELRSKGKIRFSTCGDLDLELNPNDIISGLSSLFENPNENSLYSYDGTDNNEFTITKDLELIYDNSQISPNVDKSVDFFDTALRNSANNAINSGETNLIIDLPSINNELQLNILKAIPYALTQMVLTPKVNLIPKLFAVLNGDVGRKNSSDLITNMVPSIVKVGGKVSNLLIQNIFDTIKSDLKRLASEIAISYLKQRGVDYANTLRSLLRLLNLLPQEDRGCGGVLQKLLKLLKLSNFGPMPMLPPPLILITAPLKSGMNSVSITNDIKANLTQKGIETAPTLPDGTPNNLMIAIEETVSVFTTHLKTNSTIQTFGISAAGPVSGYGQIQ